jgi:hypothetical protein
VRGGGGGGTLSECPPFLSFSGCPFWCSHSRSLLSVGTLSKLSAHLFNHCAETNLQNATIVQYWQNLYCHGVPDQKHLLREWNPDTNFNERTGLRLVGISLPDRLPSAESNKNSAIKSASDVLEMCNSSAHPLFQKWLRSCCNNHFKGKSTHLTSRSPLRKGAISKICLTCSCLSWILRSSSAVSTCNAYSIGYCVAKDSQKSDKGTQDFHQRTARLATFTPLPCN